MAINPEKLLKTLQKLAEEETVSIKKDLEENIYVVDISYGSIKVSDPKLSQNDYAIIIDTLGQAYKTRHSLKYTLTVLKNINTSSEFITIVDDPRFGIFIVAKKYHTLQNSLAKVLKSIESVVPFVGTSSTGRPIVNIDHVPNPMVNAAKSPLSQKIKSLLARVPVILSKPIIQELVNLYNTYSVEINYQFNRENFDIQKFNKALGRGTVLVTLRSAYKNNKFTAAEKAISNRVQAYINSTYFKREIIRTYTPNTIVEDIGQGILATIVGKSHSSLVTKKPISKSISKKSGKSKVVETKVPPTRSIGGQFYSLANLHVLINTHLQDVISANMGDGGRKDILNYRTGRFAASAKVDRLSMSKEGMINAFYTYMRNPYGTFSDGGRQQYPKTRDPKLLIARSIKEIAATKVANRMRAVLV